MENRRCAERWCKAMSGLFSVAVYMCQQRNTGVYHGFIFAPCVKFWDIVEIYRPGRVCRNPRNQTWIAL